jgi:hypothetical protein
MNYANTMMSALFLSKNIRVRINKHSIKRYDIILINMSVLIKTPPLINQNRYANIIVVNIIVNHAEGREFVNIIYIVPSVKIVWGLRFANMNRLVIRANNARAEHSVSIINIVVLARNVVG